MYYVYGCICIYGCVCIQIYTYAFYMKKKFAPSRGDVILPLRMHALAAKNDPVPCTCTSQNACFSFIWPFIAAR